MSHATRNDGAPPELAFRRLLQLRLPLPPAPAPEGVLERRQWRVVEGAAWYVGGALMFAKVGPLKFD